MHEYVHEHEHDYEYEYEYEYEYDGRVRFVALILLLAIPGTVHAQALAWVEPAPGAEARFVAGETFVARVRLPTALTPPPGVQQPRALVGWGGELVGRAWSIDPGESIVPRYPVAVTDVRPDASSSLVYRARLRVPPWVAPGRHSFALSTPGGTLPKKNVQVVGSETAEPARDAHRQAKAGDEGVEVRRAAGGLHISVDATRTAPADVRITASGLREVVVKGGAVRWYPAGSPGAGDRAVVGVVRVEPGTTAEVAYGTKTTFVPVLHVATRSARVGEPVRMEVVAAGEGARAAWSVEEGPAGWGHTVLDQAFTRGGTQQVGAWVVSARGMSTSLSGSVEVRPAGSAGCHAGSRTGTQGLPVASWLVYAALLEIRRRRRFGNRVGASCR